MPWQSPLFHCCWLVVPQEVSSPDQLRYINMSSAQLNALLLFMDGSRRCCGNIIIHSECRHDRRRGWIRNCHSFIWSIFFEAGKSKQPPQQTKRSWLRNVISKVSLLFCSNKFNFDFVSPTILHSLASTRNGSSIYGLYLAFLRRILPGWWVEKHTQCYCWMVDERIIKWADSLTFADITSATNQELVVRLPATSSIFKFPPLLQVIRTVNK